ncbi:fungal-specific transcription factor domain-containing protein [Xylariomycetidae sp. FL0641]|nr:fungal-specific transcription factor domain-containing protein [Xylariomycetidae sp. FL0641]
MPSPGTIRAAPRSQRRSRIPLSCDPCRARKLKCNREKPCQNCTARHEETACKFRGLHGETLPAARSDGRGESEGMRQRIDHLEELVTRLVAERREPPSSTANIVYTPESSESDVVASAPPAGACEAGGQTVMDGVHSVYLSGDDWYGVLQEINELKRAYNQEQTNQNEADFLSRPSHTVDGSSLLFNQVKPIERVEILSAVPPKPETDRLVSRFFDRQNFHINVPPIIHEPTFMREYNEHWRDPYETSLIWLGLLFSILGIGMLACHQYGEPPEYEGRSESLFQLYRMRTAQCLLSGDIAKCLPYTVETLRFNATAELNRRDDNRRGLWIMTGLVVRAAINMGYHREPSPSSALSARQAEYRRRVWLSVISMDDMASFLGGFPRMASALYSDTAEPSNLHDAEIPADGNALPPSRPLEEVTGATYLIVKGRLLRALGRVADVNSTPTPPSYETVLEIDRALCGAYEDFPSHMKLARMDAPIRPAETTAQFSNLSLNGMYHRGMFTLHRRYMARATVDSRFRPSRARCVSSALAMLASQQHVVPSFYRISLTRQLLTLAAMVLCLELELRRKIPDAKVSPDSDSILEALETSRGRWEEAAGVCDEASRFAHFLSNMLSSFRNPMETVSSYPGPVSTGAALDSMEFAYNGGILSDSGPNDLDFDWAMWNTFIEEGNFETGVTY